MLIAVVTNRSRNHGDVRLRLGLVVGRDRILRVHGRAVQAALRLGYHELATE